LGRRKRGDGRKLEKKSRNESKKSKLVLGRGAKDGKG